MPGAVHYPQASAGQDGAAFKTWWKGFSEAIRHPWRFMTVDLSRPPPKPIEVEPFERLRACAHSSEPGCVQARKSLRIATLRGLAKATGRPLPPGMA